MTQYATKEFPHLEAVIDKCFSDWTRYIENHWKSSFGDLRKFDIARSVRTLTMETSAYVCFSEGLGFTQNQDEINEFWMSIEDNAPYGQYLSVLHELFRFISVLTKIPGMKERTILTESNNPGIGKIIGVCPSSSNYYRLIPTKISDRLHVR